MILLLNARLATADDGEFGCFLDVNLDYTDTLEIKASFFPICPLYEKFDRQFLTDSMKTIVLHKIRLVRNLTFVGLIKLIIIHKKEIQILFRNGNESQNYSNVMLFKQN